MKYFSIALLLFFSFSGAAQHQPVNKNATPQAKTLLNYLYSLGDNILAGQHSYNHNPTQFYDKAHEITGKYPAIWGSDFYWSGEKDPGEQVVQEAIKKHQEGAIITLMWHVGKPTDDAPFDWTSSVQDKLTDKEWEELLTEGTALHNRWLAQIDHVAGYLKELQEAGVPVLWRPYHEMNSVWFWWGNKKGKNGYQKLWKMLYDRFTNYHKLNNLLWVWNANAPRDIPEDEAYNYKDFYPGEDYVDILTTDVYHFDYEQKDYQQLLKLADGKPIALGEVGELPKPNILKAQPKWSWFMVWSNWLETANTPERVKAIYNYPNTITRDEVKFN